MAFEFESRIRYSETDLDQKLTLVSLVDYFQDCSTFQSEACGHGISYLREQNRVWMVLSWQIEILRRPSLGEKVISRTWPYGFKAFYGYRNFALLDESGQYLAKANSIWVFMDARTGKPHKVLPENVSGYGLGEKLDMEYAPRKIQVPAENERREPFTVCRHHLDSNLHVNNGQYIDMAQEYLPAGFEPERLLVEYRQQARLGDRIVPLVHRDVDEITVSLCNEQDKPYAVVVFSRQAGAHRTEGQGC